MPRNLVITTHWTVTKGGTDMWDCNVGRSCPGVHSLADRPDVCFVISREVADPAVLRSWHLVSGEVLGAVPPRMSATGFLVSARVTDPEELAAFADRIGPGEVLGTVPAATVVDLLVLAG